MPVRVPEKLGKERLDILGQACRFEAWGMGHTLALMSFLTLSVAVDLVSEANPDIDIDQASFDDLGTASTLMVADSCARLYLSLFKVSPEFVRGARESEVG